MQPQTQIKDYKANDKVDNYYLLIRESKSMLTSTNKPYVALDLQDPSGIIDGKLWDTDADALKTLKPGAIIQIEGHVNEYKGKLQLNLKQVRVIPEGTAGAVSDPSTFLQSSPIKKEELSERLRVYIEGIKAYDETLYNLVTTIVNPRVKEFLTHPAAKLLHHTYMSGLIYHTVRMCDSAKALHAVYPNVNLPLVHAGIILHDIGKTKELSDYIAPNYTKFGRLVGHISIVDGWLTEARISHNLKEDNELLLNLRHIILTHHGKKEYGSPVEPLTREAIFVNHLDDLDAKMTGFDEIEKNTKEGEFSQRAFLFGNHEMYNSPIK